MKKKQVLYHCSILVMIWFHYFILISVILMLITYKDLKNRIIQSILLALLFYLLSKGMDVSSKVIITFPLIAVMFFYKPFKEWRDNRQKLKMDKKGA